MEHTNTEQLQQIGRRYVALTNARDYDGLDQIRSPDFTAHVPRGATVSQAEPVDRDLLNTDLKMIVAAFPDLTSEVEDIVAEGDRVVLRNRLLGTHLGPLGAIAATGRTIAWDTVQILRVADGKIAEAWFVTDTLALLRGVDAISLLSTTVQPEADGNSHAE